MDKQITKNYTNGEITIVWQPHMCSHSTKCWKGAGSLREVFNPMEKPWIKPDGASSERIIEQIKQCPSGALSFYYNDAPDSKIDIQPGAIVETVPNGPLLVYGPLTVKNKGQEAVHSNQVTAFCRCGASKNKPFCDGTHRTTGFTDAEEFRSEQ